MDERIAQVDPVTGEIVGEIARSRAHREGIWHASVHVWILDSQQRLIFQHRALSKEHFPGLWDVSAAGHLGVDDEATREVTEELGVVPPQADLRFVGIGSVDVVVAGVHNREKPRVYLWASRLALDAFTFVDGRFGGKVTQMGPIVTKPGTVLAYAAVAHCRHPQYPVPVLCSPTFVDCRVVLSR